MSTCWHFRRLQTEDIPLLVKMESSSNPFPWPESALRHSVEAGHDILVCDSDSNQAVAYVASNRVLDECSLLNICVHTDFQGLGVGKALMRELIHLEIQAGSNKIFLEVRESNMRAISLYESLGFVCDYVRKKYYPGKEQRENALVYSLSLSS